MIDRCEELLSIRVGIQTIYLVFDGKRVPLKAGTNASREMKRKENLKEARQLKAKGKFSEASEKYRTCVKGNDLMARVVAAEVEKKWGRVTLYTDNENGMHKNVRVQCIWSPYEADAQLAKLCIDGYAHAVVTEDSDVLVYSAVTRKPFPIIYKLDRKDGSCDVVTMDWLVNPEFLADIGGSRDGIRFGHCSTESGGSSGGSSCSSTRRGRRRRDNKIDDLDYKYRNNPLPDDTSENYGVLDGGTDDERNDVHCCCVQYEDLGFAPVRRTLPPPISPASGKPTSHRNDKNARNAAASSSSACNAILSYLRSYAFKEASNPGNGVRLFVQACVLSGCDYVPNRLSKVGPVTAFKLVKEASHRDASIRFERVLKSLPVGSKLLAEECEKNGDGDDNDDEDDYLSLSDTDRNAKEKYEELLAKSESVFYYHLVRELSTGRVVPLVAHNQPTKRVDVGNDDDENLEVHSTELDDRFRPCITRFEDGMAFIGSVAEAVNDRPEPLPTMMGANFHQLHRLAVPSQKNNNDNSNRNRTERGWISAKKHTVSTQTMQASFQKTDQRNFHSKKQAEAVSTLSTEPPQKTPLKMFLNAPSNDVKTNKIAECNNSSSTIVNDSIKSALSKETTVDNNLKDDFRFRGVSTGKENFGHTSNSSTSAGISFASFAYDNSVKNEVSINKSTVPTSSYCAIDRTAMMKSPFFSPVKFDYGVDTPHGHSGIKRKSKDAIKASIPADNFPCDNHDDVEEREQLKQFKTTHFRDDFGVVTDFPRISFYSPNIQHEPRRVSSSPPQRMDSELLRSCSHKDVIEILDDDDEALLNESRHVKPSNKSVDNTLKSSLNKRQFISPYPGRTTNKQTLSLSSHLHGIKKPRSSSSALLAGFARQKTSNNLRQKSTFFPTMKKSSIRQTQLTLNPFLTKVNTDKQDAGGGS